MEIFPTQIVHIIEEHKKSYLSESTQLTHDLVRAGVLNSGRAIVLHTEIIKKNFNLAVDQAFKFALQYSSAEGIDCAGLIQIAKESLVAYKDELLVRLNKNNKSNTSGVNQHFEKAKVDLETALNDKEKMALGGWVNKEKISAVNFVSPSLKFFNLLCLSTDKVIQAKAPHISKRFQAAYESMESDHPSHWANAVHECRKIFEDLADLVFPAQTKPCISGGKEIQVGQAQFKNRIICYVESKSDSKTYDQVISTQLEDFISKLEALINTTQKGSHSSMVKEHAVLYIGYIYSIVGSVLNL